MNKAKWSMVVICVIFVCCICAFLYRNLRINGLHGEEMQSEAVYGREESEIAAMTEYKTSEIWCENNGQRIYGISYVPEKDGKIPLVIFAHELGNTHSAGTAYAEQLASHGIAVYTFDFRGGSYGSRSDGKTTEMSVMTESSDLEAVLAEVKTWDYVDEDKIIFLGGSQGGMAAAVAAERNPEDIAGLILLYPAFVIPDEVCGQFSSLDTVPEEFNLMGWIMVGRNYVSDIWDYDLYGEMENYTKPVLILHGNRDGIVDASYSEKAAESYPDSELHIIKGAGHGFYGDSFDEAVKYIFSYLEKIDIL